MKLKALLIVSAIYMGLLGVGFVFVPLGMAVGAAPALASPALIAYLRVFGSAFLAIAVLNWMARNAERCTSRDAIIMANTVGFGLATVLDLWGWLSGGLMQALVFAIVHLLFTVAFVWIGLESMSGRTD
jgi:hypothetical protein